MSMSSTDEQKKNKNKLLGIVYTLCKKDLLRVLDYFDQSRGGDKRCKREKVIALIETATAGEYADIKWYIKQIHCDRLTGRKKHRPIKAKHNANHSTPYVYNQQPSASASASTAQSSTDAPKIEFNFKLDIKFLETDGVGGGPVWRVSERAERELHESLQSLINKLNYQLTSAAQQSAARPPSVAVVAPFTHASRADSQSSAPLMPLQTITCYQTLNRMNNNFHRQSPIIACTCIMCTPNTAVNSGQIRNTIAIRNQTPILSDRRAIRPFGSVRSNLMPYSPLTDSPDVTNNGPPTAQSIKRYYFRPHILNEISNEGSKWTCSSRTTVPTSTSTTVPTSTSTNPREIRQRINELMRTIRTPTANGAHTAEFGGNSSPNSDSYMSDNDGTEPEPITDQTKSLMMMEEQNNMISEAVNNKKYFFRKYPKYTFVKEVQELTIFPSLSDIGKTYEFNLNVRFPLYNWLDNSPISLALLRSNSLQVQLRFCYVKEINVDEQRDCCFEHLCIDINGEKLYRFYEAGERCDPFDITELCRFDSGVDKNEIRFWMDEPNTEWLFPCVYEVSIVKCNTPNIFLLDLKQNIFQNLKPEHTKSLINERLKSTQDSEVTLSDSSIKIKLICPLSCVRLVTPCRTIHCKHIECFDAFSFFKVNDVKYDWLCPLCNALAVYDLLCIDGLFTEILQNTDTNCMEVVFKSDNTWEPIIENRNEAENEIIELEDEDEDEDDGDSLD